MHGRRRKLWGWGYEDQQPSHEEVEQVAAGAREHLGFGPAEVERPPSRWRTWSCRAPRARAAGGAGGDLQQRPLRARHARLRQGLPRPRAGASAAASTTRRTWSPVPRDEAELEQLLDWCADAGAAAIPFGGGTSVVGGVEPRVRRGYAGASRSTCGALDRVLEVDPVSRAARIQAGATGPAARGAAASEHGLTLRHYPQSFEYSTLGGWIATRAGGHFATLHTHIDDLVESVRALTPRGRLGEPAAARLGRRAEPRPDADRLRGHPRRDHRGVGARAGRARASRRRPRVLFDGFEHGRARRCARSPSRGLYPSNCRLLDPGEAALTGAAPDGSALLVLGFESADHPLDAWMARALELCRDHGGGRGSGEARAASPRAPGATRSCRRPTCATR